MTQREHNSMVAMKKAYDAYYDLPLSKRIDIDEHLTPALGALKNAIAEYREDVRSEIVESVSKGNVNYRFRHEEIEAL